MASNWDDNADDEATHVFDNDAGESAALSGSERWYISADGRTKEVLEAREIIERARAGSLSDSTLVWRDGLSDWTRLDAVPELMQAVRAFRQASAAAPAPPGGETGSTGSSSASVHSSLAVASLPPLPPVPGALRSPAPPQPHVSSPLPLPGAPSPVPPPPPAGLPRLRPVTVTLTGAPLPPPPSLPPQFASSSKADGSANGDHKSPPAGAPVDVSSLKDAAVAVVSSIPARLTGVKARLDVILAREYPVPRVGPVKGSLIFGAAGVALALLVLAIAMSGGDDDPVVTQGPHFEPPTTESLAAAGKAASPEAPEQTTPVPEQRSNSATDKPSVSGSGAQILSPADLESIEGDEPKPRTGGETSFDVAAAKSALESAAAKASRCKAHGAARGTGSVRVTIAPTGKVAAVSLVTKAFQGTSTGSCVEAAFREASVPPFTGDAKTVFKKYTVAK